MSDIPFVMEGEGAVLHGVRIKPNEEGDDMSSDSSIQSALEAALKEASDSFAQRLQERMNLGSKKYGDFKFFEVDTLEEAMLEVLDLANYAYFTYVKLYMLKRAMPKLAGEEPKVDRQGFVSLKDMFGGQQ